MAGLNGVESWWPPEYIASNPLIDLLACIYTKTMANRNETIQFTNPFASAPRPPHNQQARPLSAAADHQQQRVYHLSSNTGVRPSEPRATATTTTNSNRSYAPMSQPERTYLLPSSPMNRGTNSGRRTPVNQVSRPKILRTKGQRPAALVNASVTYCGNGQLYAFGGFDSFTDEGLAIAFLYRHVTNIQSSI